MRAGCMWEVSRPPATSRTLPPSSPMPWLLLGAPLQALVSALFPFAMPTESVLTSLLSNAHCVWLKHGSPSLSWCCFAGLLDILRKKTAR